MAWQFSGYWVTVGIFFRLFYHAVKYSSATALKDTHISLWSLALFPAVFGPCDLAVLTGGCIRVCCPSLCVCPGWSDRKLARLWLAWASTESFQLGVNKTRWHHCYGIVWRRRKGRRLAMNLFLALLIYSLLIHSPSQIWDSAVQRTHVIKVSDPDLIQIIQAFAKPRTNHMLCLLQEALVCIMTCYSVDHKYSQIVMSN